MPASLKNERSPRLKLFPAQQPPGQIPASAPFDIKRHRLALRSAIHLLRLCIHSAFITVRTVPPLGVVGEPKAEKSCVPRKSLRSLQELRRSPQAIPARQSVPESGHATAGRTACNDSGGNLHQNADGTLHEPSVPGEQPYRRAKQHSTPGRVPRQSGTSQGQTQQPVPSRERLYLFAQPSVTERPVHPNLHKAFSSSPCTVLRFACRWLPKKSVPS